MRQIREGTKRNVSNGSRRTGSYEIKGYVDTGLVCQHQLWVIPGELLEIQIGMPLRDSTQAVSIEVIGQPHIK